MFTWNNRNLMKEFKEEMMATFDLKLYRELKSYIAWTITCLPKTLIVTLTSICRRLFSQFNMMECNSLSTHPPTNVDICPIHINKKLLSPTAHHMLCANVGGMSYLPHWTFLDNLFCIAVVGRGLHAPVDRHLLAKRLLRYIVRTIHYGSSVSFKTTYISI